MSEYETGRRADTMTRLAMIAGLIGLFASVPTAAQGTLSQPAGPNQPPEHVAPYPNLGSGKTRQEQRDSYDAGPQLQRGVPARALLEQRRRLDAALAAIEPQQIGSASCGARV